VVFAPLCVSLCSGKFFKIFNANKMLIPLIVFHLLLLLELASSTRTCGNMAMLFGDVRKYSSSLSDSKTVSSIFGFRKALKSESGSHITFREVVFTKLIPRNKTELFFEAELKNIYVSIHVSSTFLLYHVVFIALPRVC
jgi:hypothetical protein